VFLIDLVKLLHEASTGGSKDSLERLATAMMVYVVVK
jgi:hypothetical protein